MTTTEKRPRVPPTIDPQNDFRPDLEGLRGVAVGAVVLYHAGVASLPGGYVGVDVFFVLSGFLISRQLFSEILRNGHLNLAKFYARRVRRLLPMSVLVLAATLVAASVIFSAPRQVSTGWDAIFSAWSIGNYHYANIATDYFNQGSTPSPLLHFWSLGVEEQFYLVWPLLLMMAAGLWFWRKKFMSEKRAVKSFTIGVAVLLVVIGIGSFALSVWFMKNDESWAYFSMPTRLWELAGGGLLALSVDRFENARRKLSPFLPWLGLALIVGSALVFTEQTPYPGALALLPTLGTAAVIFSRPSAASAVLSLPPLRIIGKWSFSLYLWHWPILIFAAALAGQTELPIRIKLLLMLAALALSGVTYRYVENPARRSRWLSQHSLIILASGLALSVLVSLFGWHVTNVKAIFDSPSVTLPITGDVSALEKAISLATQGRPVPSNLTPTIENVKDFSGVSSSGTKCMANFEDTDFPPCIFGDPNSAYTIWLVGDSHANHWFSAVESVAKKYHVKLVLHTRSGCPILDETTLTLQGPGGPYTQCTEWTKQVLEGVSRAKPDLLIVSGTIKIIGYHLDSFERSIRKLVSLADNTVFLGDTPLSVSDIPECVSSRPKDASWCNLNIGPVNSREQMSDEIESAKKIVLAAGAIYQDTRQWVCAVDTCPVIVGNVLLYRDQSHLTIEGSRLLTPFMEKLLVLFLP